MGLSEKSKLISKVTSFNARRKILGIKLNFFERRKMVYTVDRKS